MSARRLGALIGLELTQRTRSAASYVLLGVFFVLLAIVTSLAFAVFSQPGGGGGIYSVVVFFVLLLVVLLSPALSGNAINGDRDAATLAPVQVTLATTREILLAKYAAAWITGLAFVVVAAPFLILAMLAGGVGAATLVVSLAVLIAEIGVIAGIGVAVSGILARPLFSVVVTYLVVAALVFGTAIAFGLSGAAIRTETEHRIRNLEPDPSYTMPSVPEECMTAEPGATEPLPQCMPAPEWEEPAYICGDWETYTRVTPRFDYVWWMLAPNPFVILADATPTEFNEYGAPRDIFGGLKYGVRSAQLPPEASSEFDGCAPGYPDESYPTPDEIIASTTPSWFVGLALQVVLTVLLLWWAYTRTHTPARRLPPGTRIA